MNRTVCLLVACLAVTRVMPASAQARLSGEYGLWVSRQGGDLHVGWLTDSPQRGVLEVVRNGKQLRRFETPVSQAHAADFPRPADGPLELRYGALGASGDGVGLDTTTIWLTEKEPSPPSVLTDVDSLFVVGDIHGEYDNVRQLLSHADLIDAAGHWSGGSKHVVFVGDLFDRGPDATKVIWFLYRLAHEAARAGGGAHVMLGNHETMVFTNDLRYTAPKEKLVAKLHGVTYPELFDIRQSVLGRWLRSLPGLMEIDGVLLAHGGVTSQYARYGVQEFNDSLRAFLGEDFFYYMDGLLNRADTTVRLAQDSAAARQLSASHVVVMDSLAAQRRLAFFFGDSSVFWFRGYLEGDTRALGSSPGATGADGAAPRTEMRDAELREVLKRYHADLLVVGHTPGRSVRSRFGGRLIAVDLLRPATQMLLLIREGDHGHRASVYTMSGIVGPVPEDRVAPVPSG